MKPIIRKALAWLLALSLCSVSAALAEADSFGTYIQPDGVNVCEARDLVYFPSPEGLQPMYSLMQRVGAASDVYLFIMPHGRALMSVSCTAAAETGTPQALLDAWPNIALHLAAEADQVNVDPSCAMLENQYGRTALHVQTAMTFNGEAPLTLTADGVAFYNDLLLMELWSVQPQADLYAADAIAAQELSDDLEALAELKSSFDFGQNSLLVQP